MGLDPRLPASRIDLGKLYLQESRIDEALLQLERARALNPKEKAAYSQLAIAYRKKGQQDRAREMLANLARLNDEEMREYHRERLHAIRQPPAGEPAQ